MNEELGLAAMQQEQRKPMQDLNQIVQMIMQGMVPEDLIAQGVPEELVMAAMQMIAQQNTQVPTEEAGLANTMVRPERGM